ncbi:MAG: histidine phosphatase family protein [Gammaproteobacteria bacterium]|nr:histidine phosphatase family protein [Gammaproteobacteria bacterium]
MKTLTIVRHAKSSWKYPELEDFDRPLNNRGKTDAPVIGRRLKELKISPDLIITSSANRALTTAKVIAKKIGYPKKKLVADKKIYMADSEAILAVLRQVDDAYKDVFIVGHNPTQTDLANELTGEYIDNVPTCGVVRMTLDIDSWRDLKPGKGALVLFDYPKKHG